MISKTLTKIDRERLNNRLLIYKAEREGLFSQLIDDFAEFTNDVYQEIYKKDLVKMNELPGGWLSSSANLIAQFGDSYTYLYFNGSNADMVSLPYNYKESYYKKDNKKLVLPKHERCVLFEVNDPFSLRYNELIARKNRLNQEFKDAKANAKAILNSVTTTKKLIDTWPEIKPFVYDLFGEKEPVNLPSVDFEKINKIFDLPVE